MKRDKHPRFTLTLLLSVFVFVIITVAIVLAIAILYLLVRFGVLGSAEEQPGISDILLFLLLISTGTGFLLALPASKIYLKPFNRVIDKLDRLSRGDFRARLAFGRPIGELPAFQEIERSFNRAAEELEHTEVLRTDFINNFSHEFKTPIVSIAGFAKLLRRGNLTEEEEQEYLAVIEEESLRLSSMAINVLNLTKVENQTILTNVSKFNLSEQIRGAILVLEDKWTQKELEMDIDFGEHLIYANEELLKQVWLNLLDNAVKFSEPGGRIRVEIAEGERETSVAISNNGKDIPADCLERVFNKFYQADESHSSEGNGIGLAIVKKVVELHNGRVSVSSEGGITTFTVTLPERQS